MIVLHMTYLLKVRVTTIWFICVYIHFKCSFNNVIQKCRILLITIQDKIMKGLVTPLLITLLFLGVVFTDVSAGRDMPNDKVYRYGPSHMGLARPGPCDLLSQSIFCLAYVDFLMTYSIPSFCIVCYFNLFYWICPITSFGFDRNMVIVISLISSTE